MLHSQLKEPWKHTELCGLMLIMTTNHNEMIHYGAAFSLCLQLTQPVDGQLQIMQC